MDERQYKKLDVELALPEGLGSHHNLPSFIRFDGFLATSYDLIKDKLKLAL